MSRSPMTALRGLMVFLVALAACSPHAEREPLANVAATSAAIQASGPTIEVKELSAYLLNSTNGLVQERMPKSCFPDGGTNNCPSDLSCWTNNTCTGSTTSGDAGIYKRPTAMDADTLRSAVQTMTDWIISGRFVQHSTSPDSSRLLGPAKYRYRLPPLIEMQLGWIGYKASQFYSRTMGRVYVVFEPASTPHPDGKNFGFFVFNVSPPSAGACSARIAVVAARGAR